MSYPSKGRADFLELGDWNAVCFQCGRKRKASTMVKHWQGYWVCPEHWEARHPQDFVRGIKDIMTPPWVQPMSDTFGYAVSSGATGGAAGSGSTGLNNVSQLVIDIPWNPAGSTITNLVLTDYVTSMPTTATTIIVNIQSGTTISGSFTIGSTWPAGSTMVINNGGSITTAITWPSNSNITINGKPAGGTLTNPTYTIYANGYGRTLTTFDLSAGRYNRGGGDYSYGYGISGFGNYGALNPPTVSGYVIAELTATSTGGTLTTNITINASLAQTAFYSILANGVELTSASASFIAVPGSSVWIWGGTMLFTAAVDYPVTMFF